MTQRPSEDELARWEEQFGGSATPQLVPSSRIALEGERITGPFGELVTGPGQTGAPSDLGGVAPQMGGARRRRPATRRRRQQRIRNQNRRSRRGFNLSMSLRIRTRSRSRHT